MYFLCNRADVQCSDHFPWFLIGVVYAVNRQIIFPKRNRINMPLDICIKFTHVRTSYIWSPLNNLCSPYVNHLKFILKVIKGRPDSISIYHFFCSRFMPMLTLAGRWGHLCPMELILPSLFVGTHMAIQVKWYTSILNDPYVFI